LYNISITYSDNDAIMFLRIISIAAMLFIAGCSTPQLSQSITSHSIQPIRANCNYATSMSAELEQIIANPNSNNSRWASKFSAISGNNTPEQRTQSAKAILWSLRTNCIGF
jgi:uncharacterized lipoprotein YajG